MSWCRHVLLWLALCGTAVHAQTTPVVTAIQVGTNPNGLPLMATKYGGFKSSNNLGQIQNTPVDLNTCLQICFQIRLDSDNCDSINYLHQAPSNIDNCYTIKSTCLATSTSLEVDATFDHYQFTAECFPTKRLVRFTNQQLTDITGGVQFLATTADGCGYGCSINLLCAYAEWRSGVCRHFITANGNLAGTACPTMTSFNANYVYSRPCTVTAQLTTYPTIKAGIPTGVAAFREVDLRYDACAALCTASTLCTGWSYNTDAEFNGVAMPTRCKLYGLAAETSVCTLAPTTTDPDDYLIVRNVCRISTVTNFYIPRASMRYSDTTNLVLQTNARLEKECAITCAESAVCWAYQYTAATGLCYHSNNEVYECGTAIFLPDATTTTYRLYPACRREAWDIRKSASLSLSSPITLASWEACMTLCRDDSTCRAFVWDYDNNQCTRELGATTTSCPAVVTAGQSCCYTAFKKNNCALAQGFFTSFDNMTLTGVNEAIMTSSEEDCRSLCLASSECRGVSWERDTSMCRRLSLAVTFATDAFCAATRGALVNAVTHSRVACGTTSAAFTLVANMRQVGGTVQAAYLSESSCQTACAADPKCVSLDWDVTAGLASSARCWFHYEENGACNSLRAGTCCRHYRYSTSNRCAIEENYYVYGMVQITSVGTVQSGSSGLAACRTYCNGQATCEGFTIDTANSDQCKTFTAAQVCTTFTACTTCTHYRKARYECMWKFRDTKKIGATSQAATVVTVSQCEAACRLSSSCEGYDLDPASSTPCWLHTSSSSCSNELSAVGITHFRLRTKVCGTEPAVGAWTNAEQNLHTIGNALLSTSVVRSAIACLTLCASTAGCSGVDYDKTTNMCYRANRAAACGAAAVSNCCDRLVLSTGCMATAAAGFTASTDMHRLGGIRRTTGQTLDQCAALCRTETGCASFDYTKTMECWTHTRTNECRATFTIFSNTCCDRYLKASACANYAPPTFTGYTLVGLFGKRGGTEVAAKPSEALCIAACSADSTCQSIDFNFGKNLCYLHKSATGCGGIQEGNMQTHRYTRDSITC